jgi:transposase
VVHRQHRGAGPSLRRWRCKKNDPREPKDHALGRSRGGYSTKIHFVSDGQGHPLHAELTAGQAHDTTAFTDALDNTRVTDYEGRLDITPAHLGGDKAFDAEWIRDWLGQREITPVIPHRGENPEARNPSFDREMYRRRNVIERLVGWLKECRRLFARYEKTAINFMGFIKMGFVHYYLRLFCRE